MKWKLVTERGVAHAFQPAADVPLCGTQPKDASQLVLPMGLKAKRYRCGRCLRSEAKLAEEKFEPETTRLVVEVDA